METGKKKTSFLSPARTKAFCQNLVLKHFRAVKKKSNFLPLPFLPKVAVKIVNSNDVCHFLLCDANWKWITAVYGAVTSFSAQ